MQRSSLAVAAALLAGVVVLSCDHAQPLAPRPAALVPLFAFGDGTVPQVVISQIYGGGGNAGATLKNDFVELFNPGPDAVSLVGWSVQYASAAGSTWQKTKLSGTISAGGYYLVQEAKGSGGTVNLPTPDAIGSIAMGANAGKVSLVQDTMPLAGTCPVAAVVDQVSFGTTATDCGFLTTGTLSNTTAALRKSGGCAYTENQFADFATGTPAPRNSASPPRSCPVGPVVRVTVSPASASVSLGATQTFSAEARNADDSVVNSTFTWNTGDPLVATVTARGVLTAVGLGTTSLTVTSANGVSATAAVVVTPAVIRWIDAVFSADSFPPGFQTQLFATARIGSGGLEVPATFTFEAVDPGVATVTPVGNTAIVTGVAASPNRPRFRITATPVDGSTPPYTFTTSQYSGVKIIPPVAAPTTIYGTNDEFGDPTAASTSDPEDLLIVRPQYTLSYNEARGTPNWVSYELDARQFGSQDRCNCFTADPLLPADKRILTSDYTNGGYDRGHMTRSADRTAANLDNAATFYLTNIVPQMADLNQGPWSDFEMALGDSARAGRAVYVITGPLYSRSHGLTFLKNEGKVAIPDSTWKVAFIGPVEGGVPFTRASLQSWGELPGHTLLAVNMPNVSGIKNVDWSAYLTTVDRIEAGTGYDFLSLLPVAFQTALEADDHPPVPGFAVSGAPLARAPLTFDASSSTDPDLGRTDMGHAEALSYAWDFGDGSSATGVTASKAFGRGGTFTVTLTVTDAWGWPRTSSQTIQILTPLQGIARLAEAVASLGGGSGPLRAGELNSLRVKLDAADAGCRRDAGPACGNVVAAFVDELQALVRGGQVSDALAAPIIAYAELVVSSTRG